MLAFFSFCQTNPFRCKVLTVKIPYFAYGSNMNLEQMASRCPGARMEGLASVRGWRFIINQRGYVTAQDDSAAETLGCLWQLTEEHWAELDRYEGVSAGFYRRVDCQAALLDSGKLVDAIAYRAANEIPGTPSAAYAKIVIEGARQIGLPPEYLASIEPWRKGPPNS